MHVNGSTKAKTALFWVLFRVIAKIWKKVQFGEATLLTQRLKPTFFSDFRALCMCGTRCHDSQWARKLKKSMQKAHEIKENKNLFSEIAFLAVLNFCPLQKLIFGHFWNCKKWNLVKTNNFVKLIYLFSQGFFGMDFFNFLAHCDMEEGNFFPEYYI